ncbi:hypothetical protein COCON_G00114240, partial [Conger conger]
HYRALWTVHTLLTPITRSPQIVPLTPGTPCCPFCSLFPGWSPCQVPNAGQFAPWWRGGGVAAASLSTPCRSRAVFWGRRSAAGAGWTEGASVQKKPAISVSPRPPQAQNMDQP